MSSRANGVSQFDFRCATGFTLLEVIATLLIGAIAALMAATVLSSGVMHVQQLVEDNEALMRASNCMERIKASYDRRGPLTALDQAKLSGVFESQVCPGSNVKVQHVQIKYKKANKNEKGQLNVEVTTPKNGNPALRLVTVTDTGVELRYVVRE